MIEINWTLLDNHKFVKLIANLLGRLGFVDIQIQGEGPDGGLDLFATEIVSFAFQGRRPLRWGIQCKFSASDLQKAVTPRDIQDVEGVLRSDRYSAHNLQGYMLVTNRRVSQNVVERLQGVDRNSNFRASYLDGEQLVLYLQEQAEILEDYFGRRFMEIEALALEQAKELAGERLGHDGIRFVPTDVDSPLSLEESVEISGTYRFSEGLFELTCPGEEGEVEAVYQWNSVDFVGRLQGTVHRDIIVFSYQWPEGSHSGSGFLLVSPRAERLEGMWVPGVDISKLTLEEAFRIGNRWSCWRVG